MITRKIEVELKRCQANLLTNTPKVHLLALNHPRAYQHLLRIISLALMISGGVSVCSDIAIKTLESKKEVVVA